MTLLDICMTLGNAKPAVTVLCMQLVCDANNSSFVQKHIVNVTKYLSVLFLSIISNDPNLNQVFLMCGCQELSLCINYMLFARSTAGPEDTELFISQRRFVGPRWLRSGVDEGTGCTILLPIHSLLYLESLWLPPTFALFLSSVPLSFSINSRMSKGFEGEESRSFSFTLFSVGRSFQTQQRIMIIIPPSSFSLRSALASRLPFSTEDTLFPRSKEVLPRRWGKKRERKELGKH